MRVGKWTLRQVVQGEPIGHPSHPLFVHYPTALYPGALLLAILSRVQSEPVYGRASAILLASGLGISLLAAFTGLVDWLGMVAGSTKRRVATTHMLIQLSAQGLAAASFITLIADTGRPSTVCLVLLAASFVVLSVGNWLGGKLVYRMGMRVSTGLGSVPTKAEAA